MASELKNAANSSNTLSSLTNVVNVLAPLTVAFGGMLYLAGWTYRARMISPFGLRSYMFEYSLQDTLALGYMPVFLGTLVIFLLFITIGTVGFAIRESKYALHLPKLRFSPWTRFNVMLFAVAVVLSFGFVAGAILGKRSANAIFEVVAEGCKKDCKVYFAGPKRVTGRLITQDKNRTLILTKSGVVLLKNNDLTGAVAVGSSSDFVEF